MLVLGVIALNLISQRVSPCRNVLRRMQYFDNQDARERERVIPSMRRPASKEITSDSVELCDTQVCFLHIQLVGTNVRLPKIHRILPEVDLESSRTPAKSESWTNPNRQCCAVLPTWQHCRPITLCDECKRSNEPSICHRLLSIL